MDKLIPTLTFVINVIQLDDDRFIFTKESKESCRDQWSLPGGMREANESIFEASIREVREEAGILVQPTGILKIEHLRYEVKEQAQPFEKLRYIVVAKYLSGSLKQIEDAESQRAEAFYIDELANIHLREPACVEWLKLIQSRRDSTFETCYQYKLIN
jgi:ADP-ribose pyrophosphatase YjhB (NUDIX family)